MRLMQKSILFYLVMLSMINMHLCYTHSEEKLESFHVDCLSDRCNQYLQQNLPEKLFLGSVTYDLDFDYDKEELSYLTGLSAHSMITRQQLLTACFYLKQVDRFKKIELIVDKHDDVYSLLFQLSGHLVFSRLSVSGSIRDKDFYKNMYMIDVAEVFDEQKHLHSLEHMQQAFYERGYCNARVHDTLKKDDKNKAVSVGITLDKGTKFIINNVSFNVESVGAIAQVDVIRMKKKIEEVCYKRLHGKTYNADLVKKMKSKIYALLERYGFMNFDIVVNQKIDFENHHINIAFVITLEQKKEFVFFGNNYFKRQDILDHLLMYGKSSWHFPSSIIVDELVQMYKNKGFWNVAISVREEKSRVFCLINEGQRVSVNSVAFKDNDSFPDHLLEKKAFRSFVHAKYFDKDLLKRSIDQLIRFYKQHGFWDIKVVKEEFTDLRNNKTCGLTLTLDEGKQRKVGLFKVDGYPDLENQGPFVRIKKEKGAGFDQMVILEQKQWLLRYFRNLGYSKVAVEYELQEREDYLDVVWKVILREQAVKFGKVLVTGTSVVSPSHIMREVAFKSGDSWDKGKLEETLKRLRDLEIFDSIQLYPSSDVDDDLQKPIFLKVIDAPRYELRTRMGVQQVGKDFRLRRGFTYKMGGSFFVRNPFSTGDRLSFQGDFTRYYRDFAASYHFPWVFQKSINCQYKLFDTLHNHPVYIGSKNSLYQAGQRGLLFSMVKAFPHITLSGTAGIEFMGIKEADQPSLDTIIDYDQNLLGKRSGYIFLEPTVMWQRVDNLLNPKNGHLSFASLKGMVDIDTKTSFLKILVEHSFYIALKEPLVLAVRMRGGHVFNREYKHLIPIERFYLGGETTIRGYDRDYCPPLGLLTNPIEDSYAGLPKKACDIWRYAPQGGRTMFNLNLELRFSVYKGLSGVVFNDMGALFKDSVGNALMDGSDNFLGGSGFGVRYDTPIGPLRFDIGFKWNRILKDFESRFAWYLTLGHAF